MINHAAGPHAPPHTPANLPRLRASAPNYYNWYSATFSSHSRQPNAHNVSASGAEQCSGPEHWIGKRSHYLIHSAPVLVADVATGASRHAARVRQPGRSRLDRRPPAGQLRRPGARLGRRRLRRHRHQPALRLPRGAARAASGHGGASTRGHGARRAVADPLGADPHRHGQIRPDPAARRQRRRGRHAVADGAGAARDRAGRRARHRCSCSACSARRCSTAMPSSRRPSRCCRRSRA